MKRLIVIVCAVAVIGVIGWLGVTKYLAEERATRLDRALMEAEARLIQLDSEMEVARQSLASLNKGQAGNTGVSGPASGVGVTSANAGSTNTAPADRVRFAATASGVTNRVRIEGTSSMHDWRVEGRLIGGSAEFGAGFPLEPGSEARPGVVDAAVSVFVPVRSLKSLKASGEPYSTQMDEIMYEKLLTEKSPRIIYRLQSLIFKQAQGPDSYIYEATGDLGVAGVTNAIKMSVTVSPSAGGKIHFSASMPMKMTDFKISPPAPKGTGITTGDDIKLILDWWVNKVVPRQ